MLCRLCFTCTKSKGLFVFDHVIVALEICASSLMCDFNCFVILFQKIEHLKETTCVSHNL